MDTIKTRQEQLAKIHASARTLGLETRRGFDRCKYEALLEFLIGRTSCKDATPAELELVADAFAKRAEGRKVENVKFASRQVVLLIDEDALAAMIAAF